MTANGGGHPGHGASARDSPAIRRGLNRRVGIYFWMTFFGMCLSVCSAILASLFNLDPTQIEAGLIGAFLGSSPVILMPVIARTIFGAGNAFADRERLEFRGLTLFYGLLVVLSRLLHLWPSHADRTSSWIAIGGLLAAIFASWFLSDLPTAVRLWTRQQHPFQH